MCLLLESIYSQLRSRPIAFMRFLAQPLPLTTSQGALPGEKVDRYQSTQPISLSVIWLDG